MKFISKLRCWLPALAFVSGVHSALAQPVLNIAPAGNQSALYYAFSPTNYILQSTTNLASPDWATATDAVMVSAATVSNVSPAKFYRLYYTDPPTGMVLIPAGLFIIGNSIGDGDIANAMPTNVYVSPFYMETNLVNYGLWQSVHVYATANGYGFVNAGAGKTANHPVQSVDWYDCVKWCNARSQQAGLVPVYYTDAGFTQVFTNGEMPNVVANWSANGYRLPTEAEWEKAARGGLNGRRFPWGNLISGNQANYIGNTNLYSYDLGPSGTNSTGLIGGYPYTSPVGSFDVNGYGLCDMAGNVLEWCWDWYAAPPFPAGSAYLGGMDPRGPATGTGRVERGSSCSYGGASSARCAFRDHFNPASVVLLDDIGFRCVRGL